MLKRFTPAFIAALLVPAIVLSSPRFGVGGHIDPVSAGLEFRIWLGESLFIAPHAAGIYSSSASDDFYFYSVGARFGALLRPQNWISPIVAVGAGHSASSDDFMSFGGRAAAGLSVAPFLIMGDEDSWLRGLDGLRFEFDSGVFYNYVIHSYHSGTFEEKNHNFFMPDIGACVTFSW